MKKILFSFIISSVVLSHGASAQTYLGKNCLNDQDCLSNPYGAGSPYKADGFNNPYSQNGSPYSEKSANNPYASKPPKLYDENGKYMGFLSDNPFLADSTSNPYGRYGSEYSPDSINNPSGVGSPYSTKKIYVVPQ